MRADAEADAGAAEYREIGAEHIRILRISEEAAGICDHRGRDLAETARAAVLFGADRLVVTGKPRAAGRGRCARYGQQWSCRWRWAWFDAG
jgi:hypothetical protein